MMLQSTGNKSLLQQLRESEMSLKQSQEIAGMGSWEWNALTNMAAWSENIYVLYEIEDFQIAPSFEYVLSRLHPDDAALMHNAHATMQNTRSQVDTEIRVMFPDGRIKWLLNRMIPTFNGEQFVSVKGINLEITDRKNAEQALSDLNAELERKVIERTNILRKQEEQYHLLLDTMKEGVLYVDNEDMIIFANAHFCDMTGYSLPDLVGKKAPQLFLDTDAQNKMTDVRNDREQNVRGSYEIEMRIRNGEKRWMRINGSPVKNEDGKVIGSVGTHADISHQKHHLSQLEQIVFSLSHKVRQPVANIIGISKLLEQDMISSEELGRIARFMKDSAILLDAYTKELTEFVTENKDRASQLA